MSEVLILLYHRVANLSSDPQLLSVTPEHFAEHLEIVRKKFSPIPLLGLNRALRDGDLPHPPVVITFDDGYADNLCHAKPILERYDIPATVFVTAGYIGSVREFWWDELERVLLQPGPLPETLRLNVNGSTLEWVLGHVVQHDEAAHPRGRAWNVELADNPTPRHELYRSLCQILRPLPESKRCQALDSLLAWAGLKRAGRLTHRALSAEEVLRLAEGGLVEVGSHTVTHAVLSALSIEEQRAEVKGSKITLEKLLGHPVTSFAYPFGSRSDYSAETVAIVHQAGFQLACSNFPGTAWRRSDRFQLPRLLVRDWDGEVFERRLRRWLGG